MAETDWAGMLRQEDVEGLWSSLFRLVSRHPSVRPLRFATDETAVASEFEVNADLAQELFLELFQKQRFNHYLDSGYSSTEIEKELTHIELPNLVGARLKKRYPESFRMARRVSALLKTSEKFQLITAESIALAQKETPGRGRKKSAGSTKKTIRAKSASVRADRSSVRASFTAQEYSGNGRNGNGNGKLPEPDWDDDVDVADDQEDDGLLQEELTGREESDNGAGSQKKQRMVTRVYGLSSWPAGKPCLDSGLFSEKINSVPMRKRDIRVVGRSGMSQLILSNNELEKLIVEVMQAIDSPADVRTLRQLVLSRIPLQDYNIASLDNRNTTDDGNGAGGSVSYSQMAADTRMNPEEELIDEEHRRSVVQLTESFLGRLRKAVNNNPQRFNRLLKTLWHCYYDPEEPSQIEIGKRLGVSDSLVSDNRRLIEYELKRLNLSIGDAKIFSEALRQMATLHAPGGAASLGASQSAGKLFH